MNLRAVVQGTTVLYILYTGSMDALGLLSAVMSVSGMSILIAGASVNAPAEARIAIVCLHPVFISEGSGGITYAPQTGMCSKGQIIRFAHPWAASSATWSWGSTTIKFINGSSYMDVAISCAIYLG